MPDGERENSVYLVLTAREQKRKIGRLRWCHLTWSSLNSMRSFTIRRHVRAHSSFAMWVAASQSRMHWAMCMALASRTPSVCRCACGATCAAGGHFILRNRSHVILLEVPSVTVARCSARHSFRASGWAGSGPIAIIDPIAPAPPVLRMFAVFIISVPSPRSARATLWNTKTLTDGSEAAIGGTPANLGELPYCCGGSSRPTSCSYRAPRLAPFNVRLRVSVQKQKRGAIPSSDYLDRRTAGVDRLWLKTWKEVHSTPSP